MKNILIISVCFLLVSCKDLPDYPMADFTFGGGVFLLNEGNFNGGNGSLSFYSYDSSKVFNDLFYSTNGRPLGDVPNSIITFSDKAYIVVNNSGKIEVIDRNSVESKATVTGLISPRNMAIINDNKAYVTSIYSDSVTIINLYTNKISGYINIKKSSEAIIIAGNTAYVSNWMDGNEVMVINTLNNEVVDSIEVGTEPESMVIDRYGKLWVLCTGGWRKENLAELDVINIFTNNVENRIKFPSLADSPSCLKIDSYGQTLYYLNKGVRKMDASSLNLPAFSIVPEEGASFYKIAINPINSDIFITDARDYMQKGYLLIYKNDGTFVSKNMADIIPGAMCFKLSINNL